LSDKYKFFQIFNPQLCSPHAYCERETCVCQSGYHGSGYNCKPQCNRGYEWDGDACKFISAPEECKFEMLSFDKGIMMGILFFHIDEIQPFCSKHGCECSTGYRLIEFAYGQTCRLIDPDSDAMDDDSGM
jgi:nidogen (entactin)